MSLMAILELPRYLLMIISQDYHSQWGYSCHILANYLFFLLITIVIWILVAVLELDLQQQILILLYSKHGIYGINIGLFVTSVVEIILCLLSSSLESYFDSLAYEIYVFIECLTVLFYIGIITAYGIRIVLRFNSYIHRRGLNQMPSLEFFRNAITRVTVMLAAITTCALIRVSILLLKIVLQHFHTDINSKYFTQYGFIWFLWSDFVPRIFGALSLFTIVVVRNPSTSKELQRQGDNTSAPPTSTSQLPPESLPSVDSTTLRPYRGSAKISNPPTPSRNLSSVTRTDERILDPESLVIEKSILSFYQTMDAEEDDLASRLYGTENALHSQSSIAALDGGRLSSSQSDNVSVSQLSSASSSLNSNSWSTSLWTLPLPPPVPPANGNGVRLKLEKK